MTAAVRHSDVLVVGAGSAGSVVAERLSMDSSCVVTVLEAGPGLADPGLLAQTANGLQLPIGAGSPLVERYRTRLTDRPVRHLPIVRGATVGGSGAINGGYFCRGLASDFDVLDTAGHGLTFWSTSGLSRQIWISRRLCMAVVAPSQFAAHTK
ncbi:dehydrogenase [Mycobacterium tuberculosis T17]|nr:dehydrogenase [Mycobacterium tuberculosis T17]